MTSGTFVTSICLGVLSTHRGWRSTNEIHVCPFLARCAAHRKLLAWELLTSSPTSSFPSSSSSFPFLLEATLPVSGLECLFPKATVTSPLGNLAIGPSASPVANPTASHLIMGSGWKDPRAYGCTQSSPDPKARHRCQWGLYLGSCANEGVLVARACSDRRRWMTWANLE